MNKGLIVIRLLSRFVVIAMLLAVPILLMGQDSTRVKKKRNLLVSFNLVHLTSVDGNSSLVVGGKGGFFVGKKWFWGGRAGLIQLNERYFPTVEAPEFGYIGPMIGYKVWQQNKWQTNIIGSTGLAIVDYKSADKSVRDRTLFITPSIEGEYLLSKNISIAAEIGYRKVQRVSLPFTPQQLSALEFGISLKMGRRPL